MRLFAISTAALSLCLGLALPAAAQTTAPATPAAPATAATTAATTPPATAAPTADVASSEPSRHRHHLSFGPEIGYFRVFSSATRSRFGSGDFSLGLGIRALKQPTSKGRFDLDVSFISLKQGDSHAYLLPLGLKYIRAVRRTPGSSRYRPYAGVAFGVLAGQIKSVQDGIDSHARVGLQGQLIAGLVGRKSFVEARAMQATRLDGFNFSGASINAGIRF